MNSTSLLLFFNPLLTESLDELTAMVVKLFGEVENKNVPIPEFPEHPLQEEHLKVSCLPITPLHFFALQNDCQRFLSCYCGNHTRFCLLQKFYKVVPVKDIRKLYVTFPIPDLQKYYKSKPGRYLGHLIGHEGPGSLFSELKSKGSRLHAGDKYYKEKEIHIVKAYPKIYN